MTPSPALQRQKRATTVLVACAQVTSRQDVSTAVGETTPVKGIARLSPWKRWGASAKAAQRGAPPGETCSPLRDGAAAAALWAAKAGASKGGSPRKGSRGKLSVARVSPWLGL
jgi:hypothetical protein